MDTDTIIIGAGPAGLAAGAALRRAGVPFIMLERGQRPGEAWHHHYERLHLHTPKQLSALPFQPYPRSYPQYPSRQQVAEYLGDYARTFRLEPMFGTNVRTCTRGDDGTWTVATDRGEHRAKRVIVAAGMNRVPRRAHFPGLETFPGEVLHSQEYRTGAAFSGRRVLVVGFGNSGAEIALDLCEHGVRCDVAVRGKVNVIPRKLLGIPITYFALVLSRFPPHVADRLNKLSVRLAIGDLAALGLSKRSDGSFTQISKSRQIPVIDLGTLSRIRRGEIGVRKGVESVQGREVVFADGTRAEYDAIILATGFTTGLPSLLPDHASLFDERGLPRANGAQAPSGLYFCGYALSTTGLLRQGGIEAQRIGRDIASRARSTRAG